MDAQGCGACARPSYEAAEASVTRVIRRAHLRGSQNGVDWWRALVFDFAAVGLTLSAIVTATSTGLASRVREEQLTVRRRRLG